MEPINFCYWLRGYIELTEKGKTLTAKQMEAVKAHLDLVLEPTAKNTLSAKFSGFSEPKTKAKLC